MTLNDLVRQNRGFYGFFGGSDTKSFTRRCHGTILYALRYDCNEGVLFCPKFLRCTISMYCECNNLLFSTFLVHSIYCFYCFHRVLAIAILSVRLSVRPSHGWNEIGSRLDLGATLLPLCDPDREFGICQSICMSVCLSILNLA